MLQDLPEPLTSVHTVNLQKSVHSMAHTSLSRGLFVLGACDKENDSMSIKWGLTLKSTIYNIDILI